MGRFEHKPGGSNPVEPQGAPKAAGTAGKTTLVEQLHGAVVQRRDGGAPAADPSAVHEAAAQGIATTSSPLPYSATIQRAFGRHDVSGVQAHTGPEATAASSAMGADAYTTGQHVVLGRGTDLRTVAHEAAHVIQQRGGVQLKGGVGESGDAHEQHADAVADAVVAGQSAVPLLDRYQGTVDTPGVQKFGADEHRNMGNEGSSAREVKLADDYTLSYGEITALGGDHFESIQQMRDFATRPTGANSREEIEYAREWKLGAKGRKYSEAAKKSQIARYYALASNNAVHFANPNEGDKDRAAKDKANDLDAEHKSPWWPKGKPKNAAAGYRHNHVLAINEALAAGKKGKGISSAMAADAFGSHFLTDSFSGGHLRTERNPIPAYWNSKVPMFYFNFIGYLSEMIAKQMNNMSGYNILTEEALVKGPLWLDGAQQIVSAKVGAKGVINFGDIVALAMHDYDNAQGVDAISDGKKVHLMGDGHAGEGDEKEKAVRAVSLSVKDIESAYALGQAGKDNADQLLAEDGLFAPERMIPTLDTSVGANARNPGTNWRLGSAQELLSIPYFRKALFTFGKEKKSDLKEVADDLGGAKKEALEKAVMSKLDSEAGCVSLIWGIINWTPDTGGGIAGHNQDDNAGDYYDVAAKIPGGIQSLTSTARINLILDLLNGVKVWKDEEQRIWYILDSAPLADARQVIAYIGWERLADELEDGEGSKFRKKFPKANYGT
jgi:hypothetical protein